MSLPHHNLNLSLLAVLNGIISDRGRGRKVGVVGYQSPRTVRAFEELAEALADFVEERDELAELESLVQIVDWTE